MGNVVAPLEAGGAGGGGVSFCDAGAGALPAAEVLAAPAPVLRVMVARNF
jgi:hypothetical protein